MINLGSNQSVIDEMPGDGGAAGFRRLQPVPEPRSRLSTAELAECTCPEFCERDHDTD